ncbi:MAG: EamA family transporter [Cyanobacteria bacterium SZAS LIN-3]|nr:EamA family transporter [Cyanobacteria bacterium SZAS LIN-3]
MQLNLLVAICLACWSTWGIFDKKALNAAKHLDVLLFQHIIYLIEIPITLIIILAIYHSCDINPQIWFWTGLASWISSTAMLFYLVAMSKAEASYVLGITASYPIFVQFFAHLFLGEALVSERLLGSILVVAGVTLIGSSKQAHHPDLVDKSDAQKRRHKIEVLILCALATIFWGLTGLFDKKAVMIDAPFKIYFVRCVWDALICLVMYLIYRAIKHDVNYKSKKAWKYSFLSAACLSLGTICYLFAMTLASVSYVIVITGCYPLFMYLFAVLFLKERLSKLRMTGMALVVIGGLMVQQTSTQ